MKAPYTKLLTTAERASAIKLGAMLKFSDAGIPLGKIDGVIKRAGISAGGTMKAVAVLALLGGVPLGVAAHLIGKQVTHQRAGERELEEKIKQYREASKGLETGLAGLGT